MWERTAISTLLSKLNLLKSLVSVALLSPWVRAPCLKKTTPNWLTKRETDVSCPFQNNRDHLFSKSGRTELIIYLKQFTANVLPSSPAVWQQSRRISVLLPIQKLGRRTLGQSLDWTGEFVLEIKKKANFVCWGQHSITPLPNLTREGDAHDFI